MINPSTLALGRKPNVIMELYAYGKQRAALIGPENVYDYSCGNPSQPAPDAVKAAVRDIFQAESPLAIHSYTPVVGDAAVRGAIADSLRRRFPCDARPQDIFLGCGANPELAAVLKALAVPGAEIIVPAPYFPEYLPFAEDMGITVKIVPPDIPNFQIRLDILESLITENTAAVIINNPNNPAGTVYSAETLGKLGEILTKKSAEYGHTIYILSDEPYRELVYDGVTVPFLPSIYKDTIVCYSFSKSLSLPGERIGYIYLNAQITDHDDLYTAISGAARVLGHVCAPSLWQKVIARCVDILPDLTQYDHNRRTLLEALTGLGYEMARPDGAFYLFIKAPGGDDRAFSQRAKERDLLLVPGTDFGCPGYFRLCYCVPETTIRRSLPVFKALIEEY